VERVRTANDDDVTRGRVSEREGEEERDCGRANSQWNEIEARMREMHIPGAEKIITFLRPTGSTIRRAMHVKMKFTEAMMSPVAVGLSNPTALKRVAE